MMVCMGDSLRESKVRDVVDKIRLMWKKALKEVGALWVWGPQPPPPLPPSPRPKHALDPAFINVNHCIFNSLLVFLIVSPSACLGTRYNYSDETQWKIFSILRRQRTKRYSTIVLFRELSLFIYLFILFYFLMNVVNFFSSRENAKAKRCLKNLIDSDCNFAAPAKEALELAYSDYSPFCANNRDLGATGNDQCDGVQVMHWNIWWWNIWWWCLLVKS